MISFSESLSTYSCDLEIVKPLLKNKITNVVFINQMCYKMECLLGHQALELDKYLKPLNN